MRYYSYFPGCSSSDGGAAAYGISILSASKALDIELIELEDWNCCGSSPYGSVNELEATCTAARNLALAEKKGLDLVTPCSACYVTLNTANLRLKEHPHLKEQVNEALAAANLKYNGGVRVRHLVEVLFTDITPGGIASRVKKKLNFDEVFPGSTEHHPTQKKLKVLSKQMFNKYII